MRTVYTNGTTTPAKQTKTAAKGGRVRDRSGRVREVAPAAEASRRAADPAEAYSALLAESGEHLRAIERGEARRREPGRSLFGELLRALSDGDHNPVTGVLGGLEMRADSLSQALCDESSDHGGAAVMLHYGIGTAQRLHEAECAYVRNRAQVAVAALESALASTAKRGELEQARDALRDLVGLQAAALRGARA